MTYVSINPKEMMLEHTLNRQVIDRIFLRVMQAMELKRKQLIFNSKAATDINRGKNVIKAFFKLLDKESGPDGLKPEAGEILKGRLFISGNPHHEEVLMRCPNRWQILVNLYKGLINRVRVRFVKITKPTGEVVCSVSF